ncbi:hypothetical protein EDC01DRAFT_730243 [Geopyxis carbonaria]|nr:hypothetical protein EDC01DRAFT_730243 [Geopyxis carbonaria]
MDRINTPSTRPWRRKLPFMNIFSMLLFLLALIGTASCADQQTDNTFIPSTLVLDLGPAPTAHVKAAPSTTLEATTPIPTATQTPSSSSKSTKDSTISTSTIIIIAVGLGLLLIFGGAAIFVMRRRRKKHCESIMQSQPPINDEPGSSRSSKLRVRADGYYTSGSYEESTLSSPRPTYTSPRSPLYEMGSGERSGRGTPHSDMLTPTSPYFSHSSIPAVPWTDHNRPSSRSTWASYHGGKLKLETAIEEATQVEMVRLTPLRAPGPASLRSAVSMDTLRTNATAKTWPQMATRVSVQPPERIEESRMEHRGVTYEKGVDWV